MIWIAIPLTLIALLAAAPPVMGRFVGPVLGFPSFLVSLTGQIFALPLVVIAAALAWFAEGAAFWVLLAAALLFAFVHGRNRVAGRRLLDAVGLSATAIPLLAGLTPFLTGDWQVRRIKNLAYGDAGERNRLDLVLPRNPPAAPMPILIHVHGGGWVMGDKGEQARPLLSHLASKGWLCVDANYRLGPAHRMPAMLVDTLKAVAWVKAHAHEYGGDPARIAITGGSAGGQLTAMTALAHDDPAFKPGFEDVDCSVAMAVPVYGVYDVLDRNKTLLRNHEAAIHRYLGEKVMPGVPDSCRDLWHALSPLDRVRSDAPPMLIIHGTGDAVQPCSNAVDFAAALRAVSTAPVTFVELPGIDHAYDMAASAVTWAHVRAIEAFLAPLAQPARDEAGRGAALAGGSALAAGG